MNRDLPAAATTPPGLTGHPRETLRGAYSSGDALPTPHARLNGAYTCFDTLGSGGTAIVRRAHQASLDREVAIKTPLRGGSSAAAVGRVLQEAWVTGALQHPGVVPVHDVVTDDEGCPHIVMRRIEGWTWTELINRPEEVERAFGVRDVLAWHLRVLMSVAATAHHAHGRGVLHRDLKPDNVMIGAGGETYVLDWGIAVALDARASHRLPAAAEQNSLAGTPHYMAPEMARADGSALGVTTDVYLLGGLLYAVLTCAPPHPGDDPQAVINAAAARLPAAPTQAPARLVRLCMQALALDPTDRPDTAESFRRNLQSYLEERDADALVEAGGAALVSLHERASDPTSTQVPGLFAACRLAYEQALVRAPEHAAALAGLHAARTARIRWDLARGDARAAAELLQELPSADPALADQVEAALSREATRSARAAQLIADHDEAAGLRTRVFVSIIIGLVLTLVPLITHLADRDAPTSQVAIGTLGMLAVILGMWFWARDSLSRSMLNRAVIQTTAATPLLQLLMLGGADQLGLTNVQIVTLFPLIAAVIAVCFAIMLEPWVVLAAGTYALAFVGSATFPALRWVFLSASNGALLGVALWRWGPAALRSWIQFRVEKGRRI